MGLLSLAIWTPIFFGVVLLALGRDDQAHVVRWIALVGAIAGGAGRVGDGAGGIVERVEGETVTLE